MVTAFDGPDINTLDSDWWKSEAIGDDGYRYEHRGGFEIVLFTEDDGVEVTFRDVIQSGSRRIGSNILKGPRRVLTEDELQSVISLWAVAPREDYGYGKTGGAFVCIDETNSGCTWMSNEEDAPMETQEFLICPQCDGEVERRQ